jgi:hypothetical protein
MLDRPQLIAMRDELRIMSDRLRDMESDVNRQACHFMIEGGIANQNGGYYFAASATPTTTAIRVSEGLNMWQKARVVCKCSNQDDIIVGAIIFVKAERPTTGAFKDILGLPLDDDIPVFETNVFHPGFHCNAFIRASAIELLPEFEREMPPAIPWYNLVKTDG